MTKKRNRVVILCTSCRRKKIKCNREKPVCLLCRIRGYPADQCIYHDTPEKAAAAAAAEAKQGSKPLYPRAKRVTPIGTDQHDRLLHHIARLEAENAMLKARLENLLPNQTKIIDPQNVPQSLLFEPIVPAQVHTVRIKENRVIHFGPTCVRLAVLANPAFAQVYQLILKLTTKDRKRFKMLHRVLDFGSYFPFNMDKALEPANLEEELWAVDRVTLDTASREIAADNDVLSSILRMLPSYAHFLHLVEQFFSRGLDMIYPFLEQSYVFEAFHDVTTPSDDGGVRLNVVYRHRDLSRILLLLMLVKVTLFYTDIPFMLRDPRLPDSHPPRYECLLVFYSCQLLTICKMMKRPLFTSIQALMLIKVNKMFHLNEGEGGDLLDGHLNMALAVNMLVMCGLHRDIDKTYPDLNPRHKTMLKNIWRYAMLLDYIQLFDIGCPLSFDDSRFSENFTGEPYSVLDEASINVQFRVLHDAASRNLSFDLLFYECYLPIVRGLVYQLNYVRGAPMTLFRVELYIQNLVQFLCNQGFFEPLHASLSNPLVQDNQLPRNRDKFINFIKKIKLQITTIDVIFTLYNFIWIELRRKNQADPEVQKLTNFYSNQATNVAVFSLKAARKFMDIKAKDKIFQVYLLGNIKKIIGRILSFVYSNVLFSYTPETSSTLTNFESFFQPRNHVKNIPLEEGFIDEVSMASFSDDMLHSLCFTNNRYPLGGSTQEQYANFMDFVQNKYVCYNFGNKRKELCNTVFEFFFKVAKRSLKEYYIFFVPYKILLHFYTYLRDRNLVRNFPEGEEPPAESKAMVADQMFDPGLEMPFLEGLYDELNLLSGEFYIDVNEMFSQLGEQI